MQTREAIPHLIGNAKVPSTGGEGVEVLNPATEERIGLVPAGTPEDVAAAVAAAHGALREWSRLSAEERAGLVKATAR
ncbi:MAG TPA: aldehyde dehydrogenase family protein, partial [Rubrobacteraceae bacterium]